MIINTDKVAEYKEDLELFNGYLPYLITLLIDYKKYDDNLRETDEYDNIQKEYYKFRLEHKKTNNERKLFEKDLKEWVKQNPTYKDILDG